MKYFANSDRRRVRANVKSLGVSFAQYLEESNLGNDPRALIAIANLADYKLSPQKAQQELDRLMNTSEYSSPDKQKRALVIARVQVLSRVANRNTLDGLRQSTDSFDPVQWLADISELLSTLPTAFGVAVDPEGARRILRECLPVPLKVIPDPEGGWTYEGTGNFEQEGLQRAMKAIKGQIPPERPTGPASTKLVPPG